MSPSLLLAGLLLWSGGSAQDIPLRSFLAEVELIGPLEGLRVVIGESSCELTLALEAGESRRVFLPLPARAPLGPSSLPEPAAVACEVVGEGSAHFLKWAPGGAVERLASLGPGLLDRPRPPAESARSGLRARPHPVAWIWLAATWLCVLALRRRFVLALICAAGGAALLFFLAPPGAVRAPVRVLLEQEVGSPRALRVRTAFGEIHFDGVLERAGSGPLRILLEEPAERGRGAAPGAVLHALDVVPPLELDPRENRDRHLARVWVRAPGAFGGPFVFRGAWPLGRALPATPVEPGQGDTPPGWLVSGVPAGRGALLAEVAGSEPGWIRVVGFGERD